VTAVVSGDADLGLIGAGAPLTPVRDGKETTIVYNNVGNGIVRLAGTEGIVTPNDCTRVGSFAEGSALFAWAMLLKQDFDADYDIVPFTDNASMAAAAVAGSIDCLVGVATSLQAGLDNGDFHIIVDPRDRSTLPPDTVVPEDLSEGVIWGMKDNLAEKRDTMVRFVRAYHKALEQSRTGDPLELAMMLRENNEGFATLGDDAAIASLIEQVQYSFAPNEGAFDERTWNDVLNFFIIGGLDFIDPADEKWSLEQRVDTSLLAEAQQ
jgi:ABC-type nitrate/sulfonate/bicarbonate transport system substrate-binding protein